MRMMGMSHDAIKRLCAGTHGLRSHIIRCLPFRMKDLPSPSIEITLLTSTTMVPAGCIQSRVSDELEAASTRWRNDDEGASYFTDSSSSF